METPVAPAMLSDLVLDPGLRLALLVTYAYMAVLQSTRIRLPVATITSSSCSLIKSLVSTLALPKTHAGLSSACNFNLTHHIQPFGCIMVHIFQQMAIQKWIIWYEWMVQWTVCILKTQMLQFKTRLQYRRISILPIWQVFPTHWGGQTHSKPFTRSIHVPPCAHGLEAHSSMSATSTQNHVSFCRYKKHLKLCFKLTCWETVCIKKKLLQELRIMGCFQFHAYKHSNWPILHPACVYRLFTSYHTHTHYRRNQLHWLKIIQSRASHYDLYSAMETSTFLLCLYFAAYSQSLNENPS